MNHSDWVAAQPCPSSCSAVPASQAGQRSRIRHCLATALLGTALLGATPAFAADPCTVVLCMYGKLTGNSGGSACSNPAKAYFDIVSKKKGAINWARTAALRGQFLNGCSGADQSVNKKINDKFGKVMG